MPDLVAAGQKPSDHDRFPISEGQVVCLGRAPQTGWAIPWDAMISREHAELRFEDNRLTVRKLETALNPVRFQGEVRTEFSLTVGEAFQIGNTWFHLDDGADSQFTSHETLAVDSYRNEELRAVRFGNADQRMELLSRLPELISQSRTDEDFASALVQLLLEGIPSAEAVAVSAWKDFKKIDLNKPVMMRWKSRSSENDRFRPSRRLIRGALESGQSMIHRWQQPDDTEFTASPNLDWAFCIPITERSCRGWCLYVSGRFENTLSMLDPNSGDRLKGDLRFTQLMAQFIGAIRQMRTLEQTQAGLSQFFSPKVMEIVSGRQADTMLIPQETDLTILFCDVRGFSRQAEKARHALLELLSRVSEALSVMTHAIMKYEGVIADFQGDAALAFWGWPTALDEGPLPACRAALAMYKAFEEANRDDDPALAGFRVGIGIGHGPGIAGKIGTPQQAKVGAFGPVVNMASRLEGMTKQFRVPILIDEATAAFVQRNMPRAEARTRRLGHVRPAGMQDSLMIHELLPPADHPGTISDTHIVDHESAVDAFHGGHWPIAMEMFEQQAVGDRAKDLLMTYIALNNYSAPDNWDGIIALKNK